MNTIRRSHDEVPASQRRTHEAREGIDLWGQSNVMDKQGEEDLWQRHRAERGVWSQVLTRKPDAGEPHVRFGGRGGE